MNIKSVLFVTAFTLCGGAAHAAEISGPWDIASVQLTQIDEQVQPMDIAADENCDVQIMKPMDLSTLGEIGWGDIINIGQKVWDIVKAGKPVVVVNQAPMASALPRGLTCWNQLDSWQAPKVSSYEVSYKNGFGMEAVKFRFRLQYTYGGGKNGKGKYLANVTVMPAEINVLWGYTFNAGIDVEQAVNLGTQDNPMAGLALNLKWTVSTVLKESDNSFHFFVQGDGVSQAQN
jgi:hypothetical protein